MPGAKRLARALPVLRNRLRRLPLGALVVCATALLILTSFFLPAFVVSFKHGSGPLLGPALIMVALVLCSVLFARGHILVARAALTLASLALCLAATEVLLRLLPHRGFQDIPAAESSRPLTNIHKKVPLGYTIRVSRNRDRIYEFIPNSAFTFIRAKIRINAEGFRSPEVAPDMPHDAIRIVGLGDSVMFGWGVNEDQSYLEVAEARLNAAHDSLRYDVINCAVPGYNTVMEIATLEDKGLQFQPDLVIVGYVGNDLELPNFIRTEPDPKDLSHSFLRRLVVRPDSGGDALIDAPRGIGNAGFESDPARVPPAYRHMVGTNACVAALERLAALSREHGFAVFVVSHHPPPFVTETCARLGFRQIETSGYWGAFCRERHLADPQAAWRQSKKDPHPSALAHGVIAAAVVDAIREWSKGRTVKADRKE